MSSPYSWQHTPLPSLFVLPDGSPFRAPPARISHRELWGYEKLMAQTGVLLPGWTGIFLSAHLSLAHEGAPLFTTRIIRAAMRQFRFEHPVVACRLACDGPSPRDPTKPYKSARLVYEAPASEDDVEAWLSDVVTVHTDAFEEAGGRMDAAVAAVRDTIAGAFPTFRPSQLELDCIPTPDGRDLGLVMRCSHVAFDGVGALEALAGIVRTVSVVLTSRSAPQSTGIAWGDEVGRLPPSVVDNVRIPWSTEEEEKDQVMFQRFRDALDYLASGDFPTLYTPHPNVKPTYSALISRSLPENVVNALVQQAHKHHCSFVSILYATVLLSNIAVRHTATSTHLAGPSWNCAVNLHDKGVLLRDRGVSSALGYLAVVPRNLTRFVVQSNESKPAPEDIWTLAHEITEAMKDQWAELPRVAHWGGRDALSCASAKALQLMATKDCTQLRSPLLSSVGVIDKFLEPHYGDVLVSHPLCSTRSHSTEPPTGPWVFAHAYTWQGTMYMNVSHPAAVAGSPEELEDALAKEPEAQGSVLGWLNMCMDTLQRISGEEKVFDREM